MAKKILTPQNDLLYGFTKEQRKQVDEYMTREEIKLRPLIRKLIKKHILKIEA
jgi:hypothetical protein